MVPSPRSKGQHGGMALGLSFRANFEMDHLGSSHRKTPNGFPFVWCSRCVLQDRQDHSRVGKGIGFEPEFFLNFCDLER